MRNGHEYVEKICDQVRFLRSRTANFLDSPSERDAETISEECRRLAVLVVPLVQTERVAALALLDIALSGILVNSSLSRWDSVVGSGMQLVAAITAIRRWSPRFKVELELELGRFIGARLDEALYAAALMDKPCTVGWLCDTVLSGGYGGRQMVEVSEQRDRENWACSVARIRELDGSDSRSEPAGTWHDVVRNVSTSLKWLFHARKGFRVGQSAVEFVQAAGTDDGRLWSALLAGVEQAGRIKDPMQRWVYVQSASCATPYAAKLTGRDIIYLVAGTRGGAAIRFYGGERYRRRPEALMLPNASLDKVRSVRRAVDDLFDSGLVDAAESEALAKIHTTVGNAVSKPILKYWSDLETVSLAPVGAMQGLPYSSSRVGDSRFGEILDVTIGPTAKTLLLATSQSVTRFRPVAVVVGDPSVGVNALSEVPVEVDRVSAVYGDARDLLITHSVDASSCGMPTRDEILQFICSGDVVHLACHGVDLERHKTPMLVIGRGISFSDFGEYALKPGARVVLSACSVAMDSTVVPFSHLGFPTMLLSVGASSVVASLWPVPDSAGTVDFIVDIHRYLVKGCSGSEALRLAVRNAVANDVSPSVWSAFEAYGR